MVVDTIKTRLQVSRTPLNSGNALRQAIFSHATTASSLASLYRGLPVTLVFSVPALSVYLSCYETTKTWLGGNHVLHRDSMFNHLLSGCMAEVAAGTLFTPMEVMKNRLQVLQHEKNPSSLSKQWLFRSIWREEGLRGFFRGYGMGLVVFVPHTMAYFAVYEQLKKRLGQTPSPITYAASASGAGIVAIVLSTPLDVIKTRWQVSATEPAFRKGPLTIAHQMWANEGGPRAFSRGLVARIAWGIPTTALSMTIFELLK
ncbi:hypothetical protein DFQ28_011445 [Apophysomyces sp. BC1034]|nr:hypothetical protein DFQ28_011445 [Apophysomyces sp. BC1034]